MVSQVADWSTRGLDDSQSSQLAEMFDATFGVNNGTKYNIYKFAGCELTISQTIQSVSSSLRNLTDQELVCRQSVQLQYKNDLTSH